MTTTDAQADTTDCEIVLSREFDAPRELVFQAYTDPAHIGNWWGPDGFTNTIHEMDVRPGGLWRFIMHGPDGTDWSNRVAYQEVSPPERLVYLHGEDVDDDPGAFHVTIQFEDLGGRTRVTQRMLFASKAQRDGVVSFGAVELGKQTLAKLAAYLERMRQS
jgi:uncharacterized protein YndB with AHSA1/START domain